jgi:hypothetical protein
MVVDIHLSSSRTVVAVVEVVGVILIRTNTDIGIEIMATTCHRVVVVAVVVELAEGGEIATPRTIVINSVDVVPGVEDFTIKTVWTVNRTMSVLVQILMARMVMLLLLLPVVLAAVERKWMLQLLLPRGRRRKRRCLLMRQSENRRLR